MLLRKRQQQKHPLWSFVCFSWKTIQYSLGNSILWNHVLKIPGIMRMLLFLYLTFLKAPRISYRETADQTYIRSGNILLSSAVVCLQEKRKTWPLLREETHICMPPQMRLKGAVKDVHLQDTLASRKAEKKLCSYLTRVMFYEIVFIFHCGFFILSVAPGVLGQGSWV